MQTRTENCPNCGAPLSPQGTCANCGATARGFYQNLDLGRVDIARAVEQGLDYYLLLGLRPDVEQAEIENAYWRTKHQLPTSTARISPQVAQRIGLVEQAGYVLRTPERRRIYDHLRQLRQRRFETTTPQRDEATRGMDAFRAGHFDEAAKLLRIAVRRNPQNELLHIQYGLSLLYGSSNLASIEDWRIRESLQAMAEARQAGGDSPNARAHEVLCQAIDHYDKGRFQQGWQLIDNQIRALPQWYLAWIVSAYWCRREGKLGEALARAERARRLEPDDQLVKHMHTLIRTAWDAAPALRNDTARHATQLLADGTSTEAILAAWR